MNQSFGSLVRMSAMFSIDEAYCIADHSLNQSVLVPTVGRESILG